MIPGRNGARSRKNRKNQAGVRAGGGRQGGLLGGAAAMEHKVFDCVSQVDGTQYRCHFIYLQTAISLRHSDTVDVRFMVNGKRITVALPHVAFVEYAGFTGQVLTDEQAAGIAAVCLKEALEKGADVEELTVPVERVLEVARRGVETEA